VPARAGPDFGATRVDEDRSFPCPSGGPREIGLALSGGGLRATLFHLGALTRLRELDWLGRLDRISSVSGGSIMAAILARGWTELERDGFSEPAFKRLVVEPTLRFAGQRIDVFIIAGGLLPGVNPADLLARRLERVLTGEMTLADLPDRPRFVFNAASLATGVSWRFSKPYMGDSRIGLVCEPRVRLSRAVAASAAFPPFVAPLILDLRGLAIRTPSGADVLEDDRYAALRDRVLLLDGGAYDNLGIEPVEGTCRIVLASDAGGNLAVDARGLRYRLWWPILRRTLSLAVEVGRAQRRRALIDRASAVKRLPPADKLREELRTEQVALWRTSLDLAGHRLPDGTVIATGWSGYLASRTTRLWPMSRYDQEHIVNWGYVTSDVMLRRWIDELKDVDAPFRLPYPHAGFAVPPTPGRFDATREGG
jgi:NTE family protein